MYQKIVLETADIKLLKSGGFITVSFGGKPILLEYAKGKGGTPSHKHWGKKVKNAD